ncbi:MAG TPA: cupin domain-containing protein [Gaiellaceae bacterium]|nr:cupin domain-containing protein [Gaiellaceae bacterium]
MDVFNLNGDEWDHTEDRAGWQSKAIRLGPRLGGELIGAGLYEVEPGNTLWPYHTHHANEEWLLVVRGRPTLRHADGEQELAEGDVVCFRRGKDGFHQVKNGTDEPIRVLMLSTLIAPEIVEYPDGGKVGARSASGERIMLARPGPNLDYWEGED